MEVRIIFKGVRKWDGFYKINECGEVLNVLTGKYKKPDRNSIGYLRITLQNKNHPLKIERVFLHRLVAETFIPNENNYEEVNHIDGNRENCSVTNLEWCTRNQNELHSRRFGTKPYKPFKVTYTNGKVRYFELNVELANQLKVSKTLIRFWLLGSSLTYINYGITDIQYVDKSLTTSENNL